MKKLIIGGIPGHKDVSGVLKDLLKKWKSSIMPKHLAAFLQGKNAWDGSFEDKPSKSDGLIDELWTRLLSGKISITELNLFVTKQDYTNKGLVQLHMIKDFYWQVFGIKCDWFDEIPKFESFMIFHPKASLQEGDGPLTEWNTFRFGVMFPREAESGYSECHDIVRNYVVRPKTFTAFHVRDCDNHNSYLLKFIESYSHLTEPWLDTKYPYSSYGKSMYASQGITLYEAYILAMFEYWKHGCYFSPRHPFTGIGRIIVPCLGSVCESGNKEEDFRPIPLVLFSHHKCECVLASTSNDRRLLNNPVKTYQVYELVRS